MTRTQRCWVKIDDLLEQGGQIDGFGIGTRFAVSRFAPAIEIIYKIVQYGSKGVFKTSPGKQTRPGRKTIIRIRSQKSEVGSRKSEVSPATLGPDQNPPLAGQKSEVGSQSLSSVLCPLSSVHYERDIISPRPSDGRGSPLQSSTNCSRSGAADHRQVERIAVGQLVLDDLLKPFESVEQIQTIQKRLATELSLLDDSIKAIRNPEKYHVEFA